jgi:hypothetical protein
VSRRFRVLAAVGAAACIGLSLLSRSPAGAPLQAARVERRGPVPPVRLHVALEALDRTGASPSDLDRNPFRFRAVPAPARASARDDAPAALDPPIRLPLSESLGSTDPAIPWKLTATVERGSTRWAVFSDCRGIPLTVKLGDSLAGEWTVTSIGIESATLRALDGRVTTVPLAGCRIP